MCPWVCSSNIYILTLEFRLWLHQYKNCSPLASAGHWTCLQKLMHDTLYFSFLVCSVPVLFSTGLSNGTPLQYFCLENPMDGGAWWAAVHGVTKSRTWLSDFTFTFPFHALEKEMATHSSVLAWRLPGTGKPGGLPSMGLHRVGHDWSDLAAAAARFLRLLLSADRFPAYLISWYHLWW